MVARERVGHGQLVDQDAASPAGPDGGRRARHDLAEPVPHEEARPQGDPDLGRAPPEGGPGEHRGGVPAPGVDIQ